MSKRRIVQISARAAGNAGDLAYAACLYALASDGSVWVKSADDKTWIELPGLPEEAGK